MADKNWKPEVKVDGKFSQNAMVFRTEEEALTSARDLMNRWMLVTGYRATPTDDPVNYRIVDGKLEHV
jgi:hypothetical protein